EDRTAPAVAHVREDGAAHEPGAEVVHVEDLAQVRVAGVLIVDAEEDGGVVDEHVDAPEALGDRPAEALGVVLARHVDALEDLPDVPRHGCALLGIDVRDHHAGALFGEAPGVGFADPLPRAGDDRDLVLEPHASPPMRAGGVYRPARREGKPSRNPRSTRPTAGACATRKWWPAGNRCTGAPPSARAVALRPASSMTRLAVPPSTIAGQRT